LSPVRRSGRFDPILPWTFPPPGVDDHRDGTERSPPPIGLRRDDGRAVCRSLPFGVSIAEDFGAVRKPLRPSWGSCTSCRASCYLC
jgi:hypothetical protein